MSFVRIGETTALIPEAGSAVELQWQKDGESGNTQFPYGLFKVLATVGEVDSARIKRKNPRRIRALTGVPVVPVHGLLMTRLSGLLISRSPKGRSGRGPLQVRRILKR